MCHYYEQQPTNKKHACTCNGYDLVLYMYMFLRNETRSKFTNTYKYIPVHIPSVLCTSVWLTSAVRDCTVHA